METTTLPIAEAARPRTVVVASVLVTGAATMAFLGLVAVYIDRRAAALASGQEWFPEGSIELGPAGMMMLTLVLSSVTVQWAVQAVRTDDRPHGLLALGLTLLFGVAVVNQFWFVYQNTGYTVDGSEAQLLFYVVTGAFVVMLVVAMLFVALTALRALAGQSNSRHVDGVQAAAVYWHTVVVLYGVVWYVIFITK